MFKLTHSKHLTPPYGITMIRIGKKSVFWKKWHSSGICTINGLFEDDVDIYYSHWVRKYKLKGKYKFCKKLVAVKGSCCITSKIQYRDWNHIMDYFKLPGECNRTSLFYRKTNQLLSNDCHNLKVIWEKDVGCITKDSTWLKLYQWRVHKGSQRENHPIYNNTQILLDTTEII
jgi:hypothetical protein